MKKFFNIFCLPHMKLKTGLSKFTSDNEYFINSLDHNDPKYYCCDLTNRAWVYNNKLSFTGTLTKRGERELSDNEKKDFIERFGNDINFF